MSRTTIDYGIDLGTTNSTIAVIAETAADVIQNKGGSGITPSAVWMDKRGNVHVGQEAKLRALVQDPDNADVEFKLRMGTGPAGSKLFRRSNRTLLPEELSAEVLKSLKTDAQARLSEQVGAAVITVPAAFELPQTNATRKAAQLAGLELSPLLLEPVAASLAYGFQTQSDNVYWLVYDFGGGTFDAAVMRVRDGLIQVVNHNGDNHLGGKLLDWDIVTMKLIPALTAEFDLPDFRRGNPRWSNAIGRLKYYAEQAKIEVCRTRAPYEIWIENLCADAAGNDVDVAYVLTPESVQDVSAPYIERSLGLCRSTLAAKGLQGSDLERVLMVGGTTLNPWIRDAVEAGVGCGLDFSIDPVTVVARGAAIFASTQPLPASTAPVALGTWRIEVAHEPVGNVADPDIGGRLVPPAGRSARGCTIEFVDRKTKWRSGRVTLGEQGVFMTQLYADERRRCEFAIELLDAQGTKIATAPDRVVYTLGVVPDNQPAPHTIGVGLANDAMRVYIEKGATLPARRTADQRTTVALRAGKRSDVLRIAVIEGENARATRNHPIGSLEINGKQIRRDLPLGSQVEITLHMDTSQKIRVEAYVPVLDEDFEMPFDLEMQHNTLATLRSLVTAQKPRLAAAREKAAKAPTPQATRALERIDGERLVGEVDALLEAAETDPDALSQLDRRVRDLTAAVDALEDAAEWPALLEKAETARRDTQQIVEDHGEPSQRTQFRTLEAELQRAIASGDPDVVRRRTSELDTLWFQVADRLIAYHVARFEYLSGRQDSMSDAAQARELVARGQRAITASDTDALRAVNRQLQTLLRPGDPGVPDRRISTLI